MRANESGTGRTFMLMAAGVAGLLLLVSGQAFSQGFDAFGAQAHHDTPDPTSAQVQYSHLFETNTNNKGNVSRDNASLVLTHRAQLNEEWGFTVMGAYELSAYDFGGSPNPGNGASRGAGTFQWDDIHQSRIVGLFDWKMDEKWSLIMGGVVFSNSEGGSDFADGLQAGMGLGFVYRANENLKMGVLIGAVSGLEESATLLPIPQVDWRFADGWRWRIDIIQAFGGRGLGTELEFKASDAFEIAIGITRQRKRFRLADHGGLVTAGGSVDRGVGEESSVPAYVRLGYNPSPNISLDMRVGVALQGELRTESKGGNRLESDTFDPAPIIGVGGRWTF
jgi:hypothetical protein